MQAGGFFEIGAGRLGEFFDGKTARTVLIGMLEPLLEGGRFLVLDEA